MIKDNKLLFIKKKNNSMNQNLMRKNIKFIL